MKDYYQTLGVTKDASKEDIKKAFHRLAHKYHPDKKGGDESKFKEINEAYQILSDDQKRSQYDRFGSSYAGAGTGRGGGNPGNGWGFDFSDFAGGQNGQDFGFDLGDLFGDFFGGGGGSRMKRGRDISVDIQISFAESIFGTERKILINKLGSCDTCHGAGAEPGTPTKQCSTCGGSGKKQETKRSILGSFTTVKECGTCYGRGTVPEKSCHTCGGSGVQKKNEEIRVAVPPGIEVGEMIRLSAQGEAVAHGIAGDLYVKIHIEKDARFERTGHDLLTKLEIKWSDALLGASYPLPTLDGTLDLKIPAGISSGEQLRVKGKGVPHHDKKRGDLLVKIIVPTPDKLSAKAKTLIDELKKEGL